MRRFAVASGFLALLLTGCAAAPEAPIATSFYACPDGSAVRAVWWPERVEVSYRGETWTLPQVRSGSGARYSDGRREVWEHQGELRVEDGVSAPVVCEPAP